MVFCEDPPEKNNCENAPYEDKSERGRGRERERDYTTKKSDKEVPPDTIRYTKYIQVQYIQTDFEVQQNILIPKIFHQETVSIHPSIHHLRDVDARLVLQVADPRPGGEEKARHVRETLARRLLQGPVDVRAEVAAHVVRRHQFPDPVRGVERGR